MAMLNSQMVSLLGQLYHLYFDLLNMSTTCWLRYLSWPVYLRYLACSYLALINSPLGESTYRECVWTQLPIMGPQCGHWLDTCVYPLHHFDPETVNNGNLLTSGDEYSGFYRKKVYTSAIQWLAEIGLSCFPQVFCGWVAVQELTCSMYSMLFLCYSRMCGVYPVGHCHRSQVFATWGLNIGWIGWANPSLA